MARTESNIMKDWDFTLEKDGTKKFQRINLPHDWSITAPFQKDMEQGAEQGYRDRWGTGWYRKNYKLEKKKEGHRYYLDFDGVYEDSTVWVNQLEAGGQKYGYSAFRLDITQLVQEGENTILVKVDNTKKPVDRWYSGAGIYRTVKWIEVEEKHLDEREIVIKTKVKKEDGVVEIDAGIRAYARATLTDGKAEFSAESGDGFLTVRVPKARLWLAEEPNLYTLTLELLDGDCVVDVLHMQVGIREFSFVPGRGMFVNGKMVVLKGVCVHQDAGCRGIAATKGLWRQRLLNLKEMGCNAIRAAHHIYSVEFLDLCDELGFYVYEECFDKWTGGLYGRYFEMEWEKDVSCMVKRDRNRPCIFIWGVGNEVENQAQNSMLKILKMLKAHVLTMDDSRPVTYAMNPHFKKESRAADISEVEDIQKFVDEEDATEIYDLEERLDCIQRIAEVVDVISCNYQEQWYEKIHERIPDKLILGTEVYQFFKGHVDQMQNFTCENPSLVPLNKEYVIGGMIWTGIDYLGESMGYPAKGWSGAMIRTNGARRASYYILQSYWSKKPMLHFSVMDYSLTDEGVKEHWDMPIYAEHWHFPQFHKTVIPYMIASNCEEVKLFLNNKEFYLPKPMECPNRVITGFLPYQPGQVKVSGYNQGKEVCSRIIITPKTAVQLRFADCENTLEIPTGQEYMLTVKAYDEDGNPYFRESSPVRFRIEGEGEFLAVDNGNLMGNEPYDEDCIHMYHGQASVVIRAKERAGKMTVCADAPGMRSASMVICVRE